MRHLGPYTLLAPLASGDSGGIYLSVRRDRAEGEQQLCTVKVFDPRVAEAAVTDLMKVTPQVRALEHPGVVSLIEAGRTEDGVFLATELIYGESLPALIQKSVRHQQRLPSALVAWIGAETSSVLGAAEAAGLLHLNLAPKRIHVTYGGSIKVSGVGLPDLAISPAGLLPFRAPETLETGTTDRASTIYGLGLLMYEALTGTRVFRRADEEQTRAAVLEGATPKLLDVRPDLPVPFAQLIHQMIARAPEDRPSGFGEVRARLLQVLDIGREAALELTRRHLADEFADERRVFENLRDEALQKANLRPADAGEALTEDIDDEGFELLGVPSSRPEAPILSASFSVGDDDVDAYMDTADLEVATEEADAPRPGVPEGPFRPVDVASPSGEGPVAGPRRARSRSALKLLGPFQIETVLERSRTTITYAGVHPTHGPALIKALHHGQISDDRLTPAQWAERLRIEAELAGRLDHPHLPRLLESGAEGELTFVAYRYVESTPLSDLISQRPFSAEQTHRLLREIAEALQHLHEHSVLYCNVQATGISAVSGGAAYLGDLSMATQIDGALHPLLGRNLFALAPEYLTGETFGPASDLFALGGLLYELLTGTKPFKGLDDFAVLEALRTKTPRAPHEVDPRAPVHLSEIAMRLLAKTPADRFPSAQSLLDHLNA